MRRPACLRAIVRPAKGSTASTGNASLVTCKSTAAPTPALSRRSAAIPPASSASAPPGIALPQVSLTDAGDGKGATSPAKDSRLDVRYGDDVQDWWFQPGEEDKDEPGPGRVVWRGSNPLATSKGYSLRLYLRTWENPRPDEVVQSLDYVSTLTESAPFLIAVTVE